MRAAFILNPAAKSGRAHGRREDVLRAAHAAGIDAHLVETAHAGQEAALAADLAESFETVVAVGGDGTVQGVANGLAGTAAALGVVPLGTGNDFAMALGMPRRVDDAVRALASAPVASVDLGRVRWTDGAAPDAVHERLFTNCLGVGFDALAALGAARTKWLGGRSAYLAAVFHGLWLWRQPVVSAVVTTSDASRAEGDDRLDDPAGVLRFDGPLFLCEVGNGHSVGGGFLLTPDARIDDGLLDVCTARHMRPARALRILPTAFSGAHVRFSEIGMARAVRVCIRATAGAFPVQADGEAISAAAAAVDVEVCPGALRVLRPARQPG